MSNIALPHAVPRQVSMKRNRVVAAQLAGVVFLTGSLAVGVAAYARDRSSSGTSQEALTAEKSMGKSMAEAPMGAYTPKDMKWGPAPPVLPAGAQATVLEGNLESGPWTLRLRMPAGYKVAP